jgi:ParB family chromosome partitioning protein
VRRGVETGASQLELALIENIQREDLNPVEEALAYRQLNEEYGMTHEEIGKRVGRSRVGITNAIRVLQLPEEVQQGIREGVISSGHAKAILMIPDAEKQVRFYRHLVAEGLTVRKAETRARRIQRTMQLDDPMREKRRGRSAFEIKNSGKLEDHFGFDARVRFLDAMNRFEIVFRTYSQEEVEELIGRLMGERPLPKKVDRDVIEAHEDEEE